MLRAKVAPGTVERIEAILEPGESVSSFTRNAVLRELRRRIDQRRERAAREGENGVNVE